MVSKSRERKMQDYIAKGKEIFIGLEDSKRTWVVCARSDKNIINVSSMAARYDALHGYLQNFVDCNIHIVYEAGFRGFNLYDALIADGYKCTVVPPHTVHQAKCARVKNDRIDAKLLAKNLEDGNCKACHVPDKQRRIDRQVARTLGSVIRDTTRTKNQIRKLFDCHGIETGITVHDWNDGHYKYLRELLVSLDPTLQLALEPYFEKLELFWKQQKKLKAELKSLSKKERYAKAFGIAVSLPGIGELTAIRLILELGEDFHRFTTGAQLASFVGLGGTEYSSGESIRKGEISKQGNALIRSWLIESAWIAKSRDPALQEFYCRIKHNSGNCKKAIVAVARKLITRLRSCIIQDVKYSFGVIE
ncbi:MAG: IS110 family transposase [Chitinispirillales bacterium]|jgi:transposase|nr:IS110 family transposase [Chitinispirillales bacterium]